MPRSARSKSADSQTRCGIVSAQLQNRPRKPLSKFRSDLPSPWLSIQLQKPAAPAGLRPKPRQHLCRHSNTTDKPAGAPPNFATARSNKACVAKAAERCFLGRLPNHRVAANQSQRCIPRPHRHRKIKGGNNASDTQRMPSLHHAVQRPLRGNRQPAQLPR